MANLGWMYRNGRGVLMDSEVAVSWYRKSAEANCTFGMINLALCYMAGAGVDKDEAAGIEWIRKAAKAGDKEAEQFLAKKGLQK